MKCRESVYLSSLDEDHFGFRIARADNVTVDALPDTLAFCRDNGVRMLIARCPVEQLRAAQQMEQHGFLLMDTVLYFTLDTAGWTPMRESSDVLIRPVRPDDAQTVADISRETFTDYDGHYHADPRLDRGACDAVYASWAYRCCTSENVADLVLIAELNGRIVGFLTMKHIGEHEADMPLAGVSSAYRGHRIHPTLHNELIRRGVASGIQRFLGSTQISNRAMQRNMLRSGWLPTHANYTFHKWF